MKNKFYSTSLYAQMLILFIVLLIPVQLVGAGIHLYNIHTLTRQVTEKCESSLEVAMDYISSHLNAIQQRAYVYLQNSNSNLRQPFRSSVQQLPSKRWINIRDVMKELSWTIYSNNIINDVIVFYPTLGFLVSSEAYCPAPFHLPEITPFEFIPIENEPLYRKNNNLILTLTLPSETKPIHNAAIVMRVSLSMEALVTLADERVFAGESLIFFKDGYFVGRAADKLNNLTLPLDEITYTTIDSKKYKLFITSDSIFGLTLINLVPSEIFDASSRISNMLFGGYAAISIALLVAYAFIMRRIVCTPIRILLRGYQEVQQGNIGVHIPSKGPVELRQLIDGFNDMSTHLNEAMQTICDQRLYAQQIEFKQLQAQINPHFLYNTFFMLERMVRDEDIDAAKACCRYLGEYFQYITHPRKQLATLREEYNHAMNYLMLQKMRYETRVMLDVESMPDSISDVEVPRLIFQPILENIFTHGIHSSALPLIVCVRFQMQCTLQIIFENSSSKPPHDALSLDIETTEPAERTSGLINIHRRIRLLFGEPYGLSLMQSELGGLKVLMSLPVSQNKENEHATL